MKLHKNNTGTSKAVQLNNRLTTTQNMSFNDSVKLLQYLIV